MSDGESEIRQSARARGNMSNLFDLLVAGLATGAIYALVAVGFTLLWQTSQTINFAQGEFVMLPAFLMLAAMHAGAPFWLAIILGILLSMLLLGLAFKMLLVDPMMRHGVLPLAIATMALAIGLKEAVKQFFSAEALALPLDRADRRRLHPRRMPSRCKASASSSLAILRGLRPDSASQPHARSAARCRRRRRTRRWRASSASRSSA